MMTVCILAARHVFFLIVHREDGADLLICAMAGCDSSIASIGADQNFTDEGEDVIGVDGLVQFCTDIDIPHDDVRMLIFLFNLRVRPVQNPCLPLPFTPWKAFYICPM
jgi:hypothetical protein